MNLRRFPNLVWAICKPKVTVLIFGSGKIVAEGCKIVSEGVYMLRLVCKILRKEGYPRARCGAMKIQNVVGNKFFPFRVNLYELKKQLGEFCSRSDAFPGGIIRTMFELEGTTVICFWSGGCLVTGGKSPRQVKRVAERMKHRVSASKFKEGDTKESIVAAHSKTSGPKIITAESVFE